MLSIWNTRRGRVILGESKEPNTSSNTTFLMEIATRIGLLVLFIFGEVSTSSKTVIQPEDLWRYRFPLKSATVPFWQLVVCIILIASVIFSLLGIRTTSSRRTKERTVAIFGLTLSLFLTAVITNIIKSTVGRPRPNYLIRCYGEHSYLQETDASKPCTVADSQNGDLRKSFPSGHSSVAFAGFVYLSLYIAGKLGTFNNRGQGSAWRLVVTVIPVFAASWVGATRYVDYHHHVEDIIAGSILGCVVGYLSYTHYFKPLSGDDSHQPLAWKNCKRDVATQTGGEQDGDFLPEVMPTRVLNGRPGMASREDMRTNIFFQEDNNANVVK